MYFEYVMSETLVRNILKINKKKSVQETLCNYINKQFDIKGICRKVTVR